ncbi:MAG: hypothetical protein Q9223_001186 [Gallowayella weberi]
MHLLSLLLCFLSYAAYHVAVAEYSVPRTLAELRSALGNYQVGSLGDLPVPPESQLSLKKTDPFSLCPTACKTLSTLKKSILSLSGTLTYTQQQNRYWSLQQLETSPACRVAPENAADVAITLLITEYLQCPFAVKSGGHAAFAGASNIERGITIDLVNLKQLETSPDLSLTKVGPGNRWQDVYNFLERRELAVIGGRVADIGVGGLTLGGEEVAANYQVVLADGKIRDINQQSDPDLYFALRGGGNNFGIVTRFDLETFPQGRMWGGMTAHPASTNASVYEAFENFASNPTQDPDAALITAYAYVQGNYLFSNNYMYAKEVAYPAAFREFTSIPNITDTQRMTTLTGLTRELNASNPGGFRETYTTATFKNSADLQLKILDIFRREVELLTDARGFLPALVMQPLTIPQIRLFRKNGGNALGITEEDGPLVIMNIAIMWSDPADDARIIAGADRVIKTTHLLARAMGLDHRYIYQNYASLKQDVFRSYGEENQRRLVEISRRVDPDRVFQDLQPGYFKLDGGNGGSES